MNEQKLAERFCRDVDRILQSQGAEVKPAGPAPLEYEKALDLARILARTGFGDECRALRDLRRRLLDLFVARGARGPAGIDSGPELAEEELENVAGGAEKEQISCSLCNCRRSARTITGAVCPDCGHPRECHPG